MTLADELLYLSEHDKWSRRLEFTRGLNSISSTRYAPDFNCTTVVKYLNGGDTECTPDENVSVYQKVKTKQIKLLNTCTYVCLCVRAYLSFD